MLKKWWHLSKLLTITITSLILVTFQLSCKTVNEFKTEI